jgi:amino acid adenylation domain-containing protein/non-ribosomal peptide synthase protein (TIGR01720 family)
MLNPSRLAVLRRRVAALGDAQRALLRRQLEAQGIDWRQVDPDAAPDRSEDGFAMHPQARPERLPLSSSQAHVWVLHQLQPDLTAYHIPFAWSLRGDLDRRALQQAVSDLVARHESLRTAFPQDDEGRPHQQISDSADPDLSFEELTDSVRHDATGTGRGDAVGDGLAPVARTLAMALAAQPFALGKGPLMRLRCLRLDAERHVLVIVLHHLIADGWSRGLFVRELATLYNARRQGRADPLPALETQYADHVLSAARWRETAAAGRQLDYWRDRLKGLVPLELPTDRPRPAQATFASRVLTELLPHGLSHGLEGVARRHGVTRFMLLLGLFKLLLFRYTGQSDIAVGVPVSGRLSEQAAGLIGFFVNTLVMRTRLDAVAHGRLGDWLARVKETVAGALEHQAVPFADVVEACAPQRNLGRNPLFEVMFQAQTEAYRTQNSVMPDVAFDGLELRQHAVALDQTKFDMSWHLLDRDDGLLLAVEYRSVLFDDARMQRMLGHFRELLTAAVAQPGARLAEFEMLTAHEREQMLEVARGASDAPATPTLFPRAVVEQSARAPDAIAVCDAAGRALSYPELDRRSAGLARRLLAAGVGAEQRVGLCLRRSVDLLVGLLGVLRAGAAFVPLDPSLPTVRLRHMLNDAGCRVLLGEPDTRARDLVDPGACDHDCRFMTVAGPAADPGLVDAGLPRLCPEQLAYVMYTSGSTGTPKGTLLTHRGLAHYLDWCRRAYPLAAGHGAPVHGSIGFDATLTALLAPLVAGRTVQLLAEGDELAALADAIDAGASLVKLTPAHLQALPPLLDAALSRERLPRAFIIGGEALTSRHLDFWRDRYPEIALVNEYGPTEAVVGCCVHRVTAGDSGNMPIGRPIDRVQLYVLDAYMQPQPYGVPGELYIGGPSLARGYLGQAALTAERFVPNPFGAALAGECLYRTGDLGCYRDDGVLMYLGRRDAQLQLHGYRIEPGEIEDRLARHPAVAAAAVAVRAPAGNPQLVAFVCSAQDQALPVAALRDWLGEALPDYMQPVHYRVIEALPLTANGKLDRDALPDIAPTSADGAGRDPDNDIEAVLLKVWRQALKQPEVGVEDNFFARGGDSITGMQIVALARKAGFRLTPAQLFQHQTVAAQARVATPLVDDGARFQAVPDGPFPLAPIQWRLLQRLEAGAGARAAQHNQGVLLRVGKGLEPRRIDAALSQLLGQHDALRLGFAREPAGDHWVQQHAAPEACKAVLETLDLSASTDFDAQLRLAIAGRQGDFDLARPPLLRALLLKAPAGDDDRLLLLAHHLIVDAVSWRILLTDLQRLYRRSATAQAVALSDKGSSYAAWIEHVAGRAKRFEQTLVYWQQVCRPLPGLPRDGERPQAANLVAGTEQLRLTLDGGVTRRLLDSERGRAARGLDAMLLTALVQTLARWGRLDAMVVDLEGHGRHAWEEGIELSRSVGWFTCIHPVRVVLPPGGASQQLGAVREVLAAVPDHGLGFGVLRMHGHETLVSPAEVSLNYLGRSDDAVTDGEDFLGLDTVPLPALDAAANPRAYLIDVVAWIEQGCLKLLWRFHRDLHRRETIRLLAERQLAALESLTMRHDLAVPAVTSSGTHVDPASLKKLVARVGARRA